MPSNTDEKVDLDRTNQSNEDGSTLEQPIVDPVEVKQEEYPESNESGEDNDDAGGDESSDSAIDCDPSLANEKNEASDGTAAFQGESSDASLSNKEKASAVEANPIDQSSGTIFIAIEPPKEDSYAEKSSEQSVLADTTKPDSELVVPDTKSKARPSRKRKSSVTFAADVDDAAKSSSSKQIDDESKISSKKMKIERKSKNSN